MAPEETTLLCLGPLTNVAAAFRRDPELPSLLNHLIICGGSVAAPGNVTATAEFNIYCDVASAKEVFRTQHWPVEVETSGEITLGQTVFDRRGYSTEASLTSVAIEADTQEVYRRIVSGLLRAAS
jgi:inosine-uridine nucleoside N-ribohydrolase